MVILFRVINIHHSELVIISFSLFICDHFIGFSLSTIFWSTFRVTENMRNIYNFITDSSSGQLHAQQSKYEFWINIIVFLGHIFLKEVISISSSKIIQWKMGQLRASLTRRTRNGRLYFYGFRYYWFCHSFASQSERYNTVQVIIDRLTKSNNFILFRVGQSTEVWLNSLINICQVSINMAPSEALYGWKCRRCLGPEIIVQSIFECYPQLFIS